MNGREFDQLWAGLERLWPDAGMDRTHEDIWRRELMRFDVRDCRDAVHWQYANSRYKRPRLETLLKRLRERRAEGQRAERRGRAGEHAVRDGQDTEYVCAGAMGLMRRAIELVRGGDRDGARERLGLVRFRHDASGGIRQASGSEVDAWMETISASLDELRPVPAWADRGVDREGDR